MNSPRLPSCTSKSLQPPIRSSRLSQTTPRVHPHHHCTLAAPTAQLRPSEAGAMPLFSLPEVEENEEGWGPVSVPKQFDGVPFMPFSKGERLGRIADFSAPPGRGMYQGEAGAAPPPPSPPPTAAADLVPRLPDCPDAASNTNSATWRCCAGGSHLGLFLRRGRRRLTPRCVRCDAAGGRYRDREPTPGMSVFNFEKTGEVRLGGRSQLVLTLQLPLRRPSGGPMHARLAAACHCSSIDPRSPACLPAPPPPLLPPRRTRPSSWWTSRW